ncbi:MAG: hypothetical protein V6Z82_04405 [Flavobacteriales bacterium]
MLTFISTIIAAFIASVLHDRFKRSTPRYYFDFEKEVGYNANPGAGSRVLFGAGITEYLKNYICLENDGTMSLFDVSMEIHFDSKKDKLHYQTMGVTDGLFDLEIERLSAPLPLEYRLNHPKMPDLFTGREKVFKDRSEKGFFIDDSDLEKLKNLKSIKVKVKYEWNNKEDSDIWEFDFSDENEVRFHRLPPPLWKNIILFFKRRFL